MKLPNEAKTAIERIETSGHQAYLVGGSVRDMVMGVCPNDIDITTTMLPDEIEELFGDYKTLTIGKKHGTITVFIGKNPIEITTFRQESGYADNRHPDRVSFGASLAEDLARRDFTMNALCYNEKSGLIDLFSGLEDIKNHSIRAIGEPTARFQEDALRILRGIRFMAQLGFSIEKKTQAGIFECRSLLQAISAERITAELTKLLLADDPLPALRLMNELCVLPTILKPISPADCAAIAASRKNLPLRLAIVLRPQGADMLRLDAKTKAALKMLLTYGEKRVAASKPAIKQLLRRIGFEDFLLLLEYQSLLGEDTLAQRAIALEIEQNGECYRLSQLALKGEDLLSMSILQGKMVGQSLELLLDGVINDRVENQKKSLKGYLEKQACFIHTNIV